MPRQTVVNPVMGAEPPEVTGSFTPTGAALTVSDAAIQAGMRVFVVPTNGPAGLLLRSKSCWVDTIADGSFVFNVSASGSGAPAGTETFQYLGTL